jgi:hypothetical protein
MQGFRLVSTPAANRAGMAIRGLLKSGLTAERYIQLRVLRAEDLRGFW